MSESKVGYHISKIPKGTYGEISKIEEELWELKDAHMQKSRIMVLVELSDIYGAIGGYLKKYYKDITMHDIKKMSQITERAFRNGDRK